jgi:hypothetical protein
MNKSTGKEILKYIGYIGAIVIAYLIVEEIKKMMEKRAAKNKPQLQILPTGEVVETMPTVTENPDDVRTFENSMEDIIIKPSRTVIY